MKYTSKLATSLIGLALSATAIQAAVIGQLGVLDDSTGLTAGAQYRLVFLTSGTTPGTSSDITTYNAFVQGLANTAGLGGATWNIIGSTNAVDARDNTGTNPGVDGAGVPIYLMDGISLIALDNSNLWDGNVDNFIDHDETGTLITSNIDRIFTGTENNGTVHPGGAGLSQALGGDSGNTQTGRGDINLAGWVRNFNVPQTGQRRVYAMSEILTVPVPEPSSTALLGLGGLALIFRRRK